MLVFVGLAMYLLNALLIDMLSSPTEGLWLVGAPFWMLPLWVCDALASFCTSVDCWAAVGNPFRRGRRGRDLLILDCRVKSIVRGGYVNGCGLCLWLCWARKRTQ